MEMRKIFHLNRGPMPEEMEFYAVAIHARNSLGLFFEYALCRNTTQHIPILPHSVRIYLANKVGKESY